MWQRFTRSRRGRAQQGSRGQLRVATLARIRARYLERATVHGIAEVRRGWNAPRQLAAAVWVTEHGRMHGCSARVK